MDDHCPLLSCHIFGLLSDKNTWNTDSDDSDDADDDTGDVNNDDEDTYTVFPRTKNAPKCEMHSQLNLEYFSKRFQVVNSTYD